MGHYTCLIALEELVLRCRDKRAQNFIQEAVVCYKNGAYRSAIVATWIAVVFDIIHKLNELDMTGDKNAKVHINNFEQIVNGGESKLKEALEFERDILSIAKKEFELLTPNELQDLVRLQQDRNRCAHPSMQAIDTVYIPTAELARTHIRNAVEILLSREPVQGQAAFDRICAEIKSEYFPTTKEEAVLHFKSGPLIRARESLIRKLIVGLTKAGIYDDNIDFDEKKRICVAVSAVLEIHKTIHSCPN